MGDEIRLEKDDVTVEEVIEECAECTDTLTSAAAWVAVDFRSAGMVQRLGPYCPACAETLAERIRDGLPNSAPASRPQRVRPGGATGEGER